MFNEIDKIDFEIDMLTFVILTENRGMQYEEARRQATKEYKEIER